MVNDLTKSLERSRPPYTKTLLLIVTKAYNLYAADLNFVEDKIIHCILSILR